MRVIERKLQKRRVENIISSAAFGLPTFDIRRRQHKKKENFEIFQTLHTYFIAKFIISYFTAYFLKAVLLKKIA